LRDISVSVDIRLRDLLLSFRALSSLPELLATSEEVRVQTLVIRPLCAPLPFDLRCVHSRKLALPSVRRCDPSNPVPPSGFLTPSAVCSASALRVCCAPLPAMGSVAFPGARPTLSVEVGTDLPFPAPRMTLRRVPLVSSRSAFLRSLPPCRFRPSSCPAARLPKKKGGSGPPAAGAVGISRGRAVTGATVADGRGRRNPREYLPHRPKPVRNLHSPKPVEALPGDRAAVHRGGRCFDREAGASCLPAAEPAEAGPGGRGANPQTAEAARGLDGASVPAEAGPCVPCGASVSAEAGPCVPCGDSAPAEAGVGGPAGRCSDAAEAVRNIGTGGARPAEAGRALPAAAGEGGVNRRPASQAEAARISTEVETEPEDRVLGLDEAPIRRSGPPHQRGGPGCREVRGDPTEIGPSVPSRAPEFVAPFRGTRFQVPGSDALRGSGRTSRPCSTDESVAVQHRCQRCAARVSHGLVSSSRSSRTRRCPTAPCAPKRSGFRWPPSEPKPEVRPGKVPPVGRPPGGVSVRFPAASGEGGPQHPFVGCSRRPVRRLLPGLVSPRRPRSLSGSESREPRSDFEPFVASGFSSGPSRWPP
jgi:hypothetical protein